MTEDKLEEIIGPFAMKEYQRAPEQVKEALRIWAKTLRDLSDTQFVDECAEAVLSATRAEAEQRVYGSHPTRRDELAADYASADICYHEAKRRHQEAGHDPSCRGDTLYSAGFNRAYASQGFEPSDPIPCTCNKENSDVA